MTKRDNISLIINTDGGSRGNPGHAAIGIVIKNETTNDVHEHARYIGKATNNFAEYTAVKEALNIMKEKYKNETCEVNASFFLDSELVVRQLTGIYKIKDPILSALAEEIKSLAINLTTISFHHIKRELNKEADALVNKALDEQLLK